MTQLKESSRMIRMTSAKPSPSRRASACLSSGSLSTRIEMNTMLSMPRTISRASSVKKATQISGFSNISTLATSRILQSNARHDAIRRGLAYRPEAIHRSTWEGNSRNFVRKEALWRSSCGTRAGVLSRFPAPARALLGPVLGGCLGLHGRAVGVDVEAPVGELVVPAALPVLPVPLSYQVVVPVRAGHGEPRSGE